MAFLYHIIDVCCYHIYVLLFSVKLYFRALTSSLFTPELTLSMKKKRFLESFPLHGVPTQLCIPTDPGPLGRCVNLSITAFHENHGAELTKQKKKQSC